MSPKRLVTIAVTLLVLVVAGAIGFYFLRVVPAREAAVQAQVLAEISSGNAALREGRSVDAISSLNEVLSQPSLTGVERARASIDLAAAYLYVNPELGLGMLKQLSINPNVPAWYRAEAVDQIISFWSSTQDTALAKSTIFTGPTWGSFLGPTDTVDIANRRALEWGTSIYPLFGLEYRLALAYITAATQTSDRALISTLIASTTSSLGAGDTDFVASQQANVKAQAADQEPPFSNFQVGVGLLTKARVLSGLYHVRASLPNPKSVSVSMVETTFQSALSYLEKDPTEVSSSASALFARYFFAAFLSRDYVGADTSTVQQTLTPIYSAYQNPALRDKSFFTTVRLYGTDRMAHTATRENMVRLAAIDPRFKSLLISLGWPQSAFQ